jgi:DNA-binding NarL/FixJ family response regulator
VNNGFALIGNEAKKMKSNPPLKVLLIEEKAWLRELFKPTLCTLGCDVIGETGAHHIGAQMYKRHRPHLVLSNIELALGTGFDLLRDILAIDPTAYVVMLSVNDDELTRKTCFDLGARGFISKNRPIDMFIDELQSHLSVFKLAA